MHRFMRAIGFSTEGTRENRKRLLSYVVTSADESRVVSAKEGHLLVEYRKYFGDRIGIIVRGTFEPGESGAEEYFVDYSVPFLKAVAISSTDKVTFESFADKLEYVGICDDYRLGMPLIFYLQNMNELLSQTEPVQDRAIDVFHVSLSALSVKGSIMMPIEKSESDEQLMKKRKRERDELYRRAKTGDESAIENITIEDMDTYSIVKKKSKEEDVFSLVDSYFMTVGIECDQYSILGEIKDVNESINQITGEEVVILDIVANDIFFDVCINRKDLVGEPEIGRRFKGDVWMQGTVAF